MMKLSTAARIVRQILRDAEQPNTPWYLVLRPFPERHEALRRLLQLAHRELHGHRKRTP